MNLHQANVVELAACAERTSTLTGSGVEIRDFDGVAQVILMSSAATAGTTPTLNVKLQECDTVGGSYTDVAGATFSEVTDAADACQMIAIKPGELKPFIKVIGTIAGTSTPTFQFGVVLVGTLHAGRNASQDV